MRRSTETTESKTRPSVLCRRPLFWSASIFGEHVTQSSNADRRISGMFRLPKRSLPVLLITCGSISVLLAQQPPTSSASGTVRSIAAPTVPLPAESESADVRKFSFIAYGDTRGQVDGQELQPDHTRVIDAMLATIAAEKAAGFPVRFVIQSGDAVTSGGVVDQWNLRFIPLIERLMHDGGVPYFFAVGNHDVGGAPA